MKRDSRGDEFSPPPEPPAAPKRESSRELDELVGEGRRLEGDGKLEDALSTYRKALVLANGGVDLDLKQELVYKLEEITRKLAEERKFDRHMPMLQPLIRKYVYARVVEMEGELSEIPSRELGAAVQQKFRERFPKFVEYLKLAGLKNAEHERDLIFQLMLRVSAPLLDDLQRVLASHEGETIDGVNVERVKADFERKRSIGADLFLKLPMAASDYMLLEKLKSLREKIEELLISYSDWE
ncbi:MAG: hypothetical protein ACTSU5_21020 [Promethearchaeota archaeon]